MKRNREQVIAWIGLSEGGYVNHPKDPGGATNRGITQRTYNAWLKKRGRPQQSVRQITKSEADTIVFEEYMQPVRFDDLFDGLDYAVADFAVNSGPARAAKNLQKLVGATQDGVIGAQTLAAIPSSFTQRAALLDRYADGRLAFVKGLSTWATFGKGWTKRYEGGVLGTQPGSDIGVRDRSMALLINADEAKPRPIPAPSPVGPDKAREDDLSCWRKLLAFFGFGA